MVAKRKTVVVIPARLDSKRLPKKMILEIAGKPLLYYTWSAALKTGFEVFIATDSGLIASKMQEFGANVVLTGKAGCGTERVAMAVDEIGLSERDVVVNLQGDEPFIEAEVVREVAKEAATFGCIATAATYLSEDEAQNPAKVKVVLDKDGYAMYFSRAAIPYARDERKEGFLLHIGIYAYPAKTLKEIASLDSCPLEETEKLEQLRWMWHGYRVKVVYTSYKPFGVDTMEDYERFKSFVEKSTE